MTDAPKIDTQAPDMIHAAGERLLVEIDMLRDIAGTPDASSICDELRQWVRARIDDRLTSAAREAAAAQAMREAFAALDECLEWMEQLRASGDAGFWEWQPGDAYNKGMALIARGSKEGQS